jgi:hypothetical protein
MKWNGRTYRPANAQYITKKKPFDFQEALKPYGEKELPVWSAIVAVNNETSEPIPSTPTPTPTTTLTSTPTPTTTLTSTPTPTTTLTSTPTPSPTTTLTSTPTPSPTTTLTSTPTPTTTSTLTLTPTPTRTPTPTQAFNANAATYLNAILVAGGTGITSTVSAATNTLFTELTSAGIYSKLDTLYLFLGGTAPSTALNGIRANSTFDLNWVGSLTFNSSGVLANNGWAETSYVPSVQSSPTNHSFGYYITGGNLGNNGGEVYAFGAYDGTDIQAIRYQVYNQVWGVYGYNTTWQPESSYTGSTSGSWIATFNSTPIKQGFKNASSTSSGANISGSTPTQTPSGSSALPSVQYFVSTININNEPYVGNFYTGTWKALFMGDYLTPAEVTTIDSLINTFQTTLGRNSY